MFLIFCYCINYLQEEKIVPQIICINEGLNFAFAIRIGECLKTRPWRHMAAWLEAPRFIYRIDNASVFRIR